MYKKQLQKNYVSNLLNSTESFLSKSFMFSIKYIVIFSFLLQILMQNTVLVFQRIDTYCVFNINYLFWKG